MKVCVLAIANPLLWVGHYVKAFRAVAEVITVGPAMSLEHLEKMGLGDRSDLLQSNDIDMDLGKEIVLADILPAGWTPDLIVGISNFGVPLCPDMRSFDCPRVFLSIDTWQYPLDYIDALQYHLVFAAQKSFVPALRATGTRHAAWLPLACDPEEHFPERTGPTHDIAFAGTVESGVYDERQRLLGALAHKFRVHSATKAYGSAFREAVCAGKLAFNHSAVKDVNMRIFEAMAMGVPLLTNRDAVANGLGDLFEDGTHLALYGSPEELEKKATFYLQNPDAAHAMAEAARKEVLEKHTYGHRVQEILRAVRDLVPGFPESPPNRKAAPRLLLQHVPWGARRFLDAGMKLERDQAILRALGVEILAGTGLAPASTDMAWDELYAWRLPDGARFSMDAAAVAGLDRAPEEPRVVFALAAESLCPGGTLLIALNDAEFHRVCGGLDGGGLMAAFRSFDCHLTGLIGAPAPDGSGVNYLLIARKRTKTLRTVVSEGLANIEVDASHALAWVEQLPFDQ